MEDSQEVKNESTAYIVVNDRIENSHFVADKVAVDNTNIFTAKIFEIDRPNKNGRIYTAEVAKDLVETTINQKIFGEVGGSTKSYIDFSKISHMITNLRIEDGYVVGDVQILNTPSGQDLKNIMDTQPIDFRISGSAKISVGGEVSNLQVVSINAVMTGA